MSTSRIYCIFGFAIADVVEMRANYAGNVSFIDDQIGG